MRGKQGRQTVVQLKERITPADAGKTRAANGGAAQRTDHPRGCGENGLHVYGLRNQIGSPPRMRGKQLFNEHYINPARITPADAGKTAEGRNRQRENKDHPRGCGENHLRRSLSGCVLGSPPRMRGKRMKEAERDGYLGITPADAGKTPTGSPLSFPPRDHPRGCGENLFLRLLNRVVFGSPPRMRGKH